MWTASAGIFSAVVGSIWLAGYADELGIEQDSPTSASTSHCLRQQLQQSEVDFG